MTQTTRRNSNLVYRVSIHRAVRDLSDRVVKIRCVRSLARAHVIWSRVVGVRSLI